MQIIANRISSSPKFVQTLVFFSEIMNFKFSAISLVRRRFGDPIYSALSPLVSRKDPRRSDPKEFTNSLELVQILTVGWQQEEMTRDYLTNSWGLQSFLIAENWAEIWIDRQDIAKNNISFIPKIPMPTPVTPRLPPPVRLQFCMPAPWIYHLCPRYNHFNKGSKHKTTTTLCPVRIISAPKQKKKVKDSTVDKKDWKQPEPSSLCTIKNCSLDWILTCRR